MKRLLNIFIVFVLGIMFLSPKNIVYAAQCENTTVQGLGVSFVEKSKDSLTFTVNFTGSGRSNTERSYFTVESNIFGANITQSPPFYLNGNTYCSDSDPNNCVETTNLTKATWTITDTHALDQNWGVGDEDKYYIDLVTQGRIQCDIGSYTVLKGSNPGPNCQIEISQTRSDGETCWQTSTTGSNICFEQENPIFINISNLQNTSGETWNYLVGLEFPGLDWEADTLLQDDPKNGFADFKFVPNDWGQYEKYTINVTDRWGSNEKFPGCSFELDTYESCSGLPCPEQTIIETFPESQPNEPFSICKQIPPEFVEQRKACIQCTGGTIENDKNLGVWTAVGCIKRDPQSILQSLIRLGLGISGGVALLTFLAAGFIFSTSQGDPKKYETAKEMMTAAVVGIIFVIFSVTLLQFIGSDILKIPGFGG